MSENKTEELEVTTAFAVVMSLDGTVAVVGDLPLKMLRNPSHTDIQMMSSFVYDSLAHPKKPEEPSQQDALRDALKKRMEESE